MSSHSLPVSPSTMDDLVDFDPFAQGEILQTAPTTEAQREIWAATQLGDDASCAFNESVSLRLRGALDVPALEGALAALVDRHEALRSTFSPDGLSMLVSPNAAPALPVVDLSADASRDEALAALLRNEVTVAFDLEHGPLFKATLVRMGAEDHVLVLTAHHMVLDGWSTAIVLKELGALYTARRTSTPANLPAAQPFSAYAPTADAGPDVERSERYWLQKLAGTIPVLDLPADRPRPAARSYAADRVDYTFDAQLVKDLRAFAAKERASLFMVVLTGVYGLMQRLTAQQDVIVGTMAAGQMTAGDAPLVGHCVNMLPMRVAVAPETGFTSLLKTVRSSVLDAYEHSQCTLGTLLKQLPITRDPSRLPLTPVLFNLDPKIEAASLGFAGLEVDYDANARTYENFELFINGVETAGGLVLQCQYGTALFDAETIRRRMAELETLLRSALAEPTRGIGELNVLSAEEQTLLTQWNDTAMALPGVVGAHELIAKQALATPTAVAVRDDSGASYTYAELDAKANQLAHQLRGMGVGPDVLVGLCMTRTRELLVALLGVLKAGGAYVPIDPDYPRERIAYMLESAEAPVVVTERALAESLTTGTAATLVVDGGDAAVIAAQPATAPDTGLAPDHIAYVIYTSGSTGKPKGVEVPHGALVNFLTSMAQTPGMTKDDVLVAVTTLSFDIAGLELYLPLTVGARVELASRETATDGALLLERLERSGATVLQATPATWRLLLDNGLNHWSGSRSLRAFCGGEALPVEVAKALAPRVKALWNLYGPTETTIWSTAERVSQDGVMVEGQITIGRPIANTQVYILDATREQTPIGVPGELWIGGAGVARGYHGRADLTTERFVDDPFGPPGSRMYRTGDLARWRADGRLEHLGRLDFQVKVRGFRIELGEIEAVLVTHPSVRQAVATVQEPKPGDQRLVAFVVPAAGEKPDAAALRAHLRGALPEYMIPQHLTSIDTLPLTANGKVDRKALPLVTESAAPAEGGAYVAPSTPTEQLLATIFGEVLGLTRVAADSNFFELGGHSLLATRLVQRLRKEHQIDLPLRKLFEAPTVQSLAAIIDGGQAVDAASAAANAIPVVRLDRDTNFPVSLQQHRLWYLEHLEADASVHNLPAATRFVGALDVEALRKTIAGIAARHDPIRTVIREVNGEPVQVVDPTLTVELPVVDMTHVQPEERDAVGQKLCVRDSRVPLDVHTGPMLRTTLYKFADDDHLLFFVAHNSMWDGWSFDNFRAELGIGYEAFAKGAEPTWPALPVRYGDFAAWQQEWLKGQELERLTAYWMKQLGGELPALNMPTDYPRPPIRGTKGARERFHITPELASRLNALGRQHGATTYMVLLALFETLLHRYTGQEDLLVSTPVRGRPRVEFENLIGYFTNTLVLRAKIDGGASFVDVLKRVRDVVLDGMANQDMPIDKLVQVINPPRDLSRTPLYQAYFSYQDVSARGSRIADLDALYFWFDQETVGTDIMLWVHNLPQGINGALDYRTDLWKPETMARFLRHFLQLAESVVAAPTTTVSALEIIPADEKALVSETWAHADASLPAPTETVVAMIERQAQAKPEATAVVAEDGRLTYAQLDERANRIAHLLRARGVGRGATVAVYLERTTDLPATLLGILKSGAAYLPLATTLPEARAQFKLQDTGVAVVVTTSELSFSLPETTAQTLCLDDAAEIAAQPATAPADAPAGDDLAYVIYTSGSMGVPKGVEVPHSALANLLASMAREPGMTANDVLLAITTISFDIAALELFLPLVAGAQLALATVEDTHDGALLAEKLEAVGATVMQGTPATWHLLLENGWQGSKRLRALCGGETLPRELADRVLDKVAALWNLYGPTETTIWSSVERVTRGAGAVSIGRAIANTELHVLGARGERLPVGVIGELWIGGAGVARGYHARPELTAERFVPNPFGAGQLYRTGDLVRWNADGKLEHFGRADAQVKVRGFRIELGEIETALAAHETVKECAVAAWPVGPGDTRLVAYVAYHDANEELTASDVRRFLRTTLPDYMIPSFVVGIDAVPVSANGKVDRRQLPNPFQGGGMKQAEYEAPTTRAEQEIASVWQELLQVPRVGLQDNFFELGGHSLLSMTAVYQVEQRLGWRMDPRAMYFQSLQQIAASYDAKSAEVVPA